MAFTTPRTWVTAAKLLASQLNEQVRDNLRYLKGLDGVPTIESGLIIDNTDGDEYLKLPLLSTAECSSVLDAEGKFAFDEQTHRPKYYNGSAVVQIHDIASLFIASEAAGDTIYRGASVWSRLAKGTAGQYLRMDGSGDYPSWVTGIFQSKIVSGTFNAVSGDQAVTGAGFAPVAAIVWAAYAEGALSASSQGFSDSSIAEACSYQLNNAGAVSMNIATANIVYNSVGGAGWTAVTKTMDADGLTFTWTKAGAPLNPCTYSILFLG